ncbi:MAG: hypothetical protein VYC39_03975 [Myxococcota bacterium]|nr:hypothetical protein [Myxococcota bacterium]
MTVDSLEIVWRRLWSEIRDLQQRSNVDRGRIGVAEGQHRQRIEYLRRKARKIRESLRN